MKPLWTLLIVLVMSSALLACATTGTGTAKVKCPACGYEFDAPKE